MPSKTIRVAILLAWCWLAAASEKSVHWSELGRMVSGKTIVVGLSDGQRVRGEVLAVEADSVLLESRQGRRSLARSTIRDVRVPRRRGLKWRILGTAIGAGAGLAASAPILTETHNEGSGRYDGAAIGLIGGLAAAGFLFGWSVDRGSDAIQVLPN